MPFEFGIAIMITMSICLFIVQKTYNFLILSNLSVCSNIFQMKSFEIIRKRHLFLLINDWRHDFWIRNDYNVHLSVHCPKVQPYNSLILSGCLSALSFLNEIPWTHDICPLLLQKQTYSLLFAKQIDRIIKLILLIFIVRLRSFWSD